MGDERGRFRYALPTLVPGPPEVSMTKLVAILAAALPLAALAQEAAPAQPAPPPAASPQQPPPPAAAAPQHAPPPVQPPQQPPQYVPPPQYTPPPPQGQYAPPPQYAAPPQYPPAQYPPPQAAPYRRPDRQRDRWYIGFGVGGGNGRVRFAGETLSFEDFLGEGVTPGALHFEIGATVTPRLLLGFDLRVIAASADYRTAAGDLERSLGIVNLDGVATFFPWERGLFVRGGIGLSSLNATERLNGTRTDASATGANLLAGIGYAFWLGRSFNLTLNLDFSGQSYGSSENWEGGEGPEASSFWALGLGFDWY
jgi:hypothetical protein